MFWCLTWGSNPGFSSNKPTHYLLDHCDYNALIISIFLILFYFYYLCIWSLATSRLTDVVIRIFNNLFNILLLLAEPFSVHTISSLCHLSVYVIWLGNRFRCSRYMLDTLGCFGCCHDKYGVPFLCYSVIININQCKHLWGKWLSLVLKIMLFSNLAIFQWFFFLPFIYNFNTKATKTFIIRIWPMEKF